MITLRENQSEPIAKAIQFFQEKKPKPSLIVLPTAWGKSILTAFVAKNTDDRLLVFNSSKSEYTEDSVQRAYDANGGTQGITDTLDKHPERKHVLAFVPSVQDAIDLSQRYQNSGVIYGEQDKREREQTVARFRSGEIRVLFNVRVLSTGFDFTGIDCIVLGISTASIALYYQIIGRGTRIDPEKRDCLISDLGGNVERFGRVEDIVFEKGRLWRMFGTGGRLLSGIPIHDIGKYSREDTQAIDAQKVAPIEVMPFGKYQGERIANIPLNYRQWMIRSFDWNARNEKLRQSILATM